MPKQPLHGIRSFFEPSSVAVAGVSTDPDKLGSIIFANLLANASKGLLKASVYALNPAHNRIGDQPCYPTIDSLPETPELLIVAVPESTTLELMRVAADAGVKAAVMITGGYSEAGRGDLEKEIGRIAKRRGMRILGPNTIGVVDTKSGVDSLFLRSTKKLPDGSQVVSLLEPLPGEVAIVTQSGHLGETISEQLAASGIGIRALVGTGNQIDVSVEDVIQYFADDEHTKVIGVYLEGVRDGRRFMRAAAHAALRKPLVVFKVGKTGVGARAALTHTASLVGDYQVYRAAFRQSGVVEATEFQELVDYCVSLSMLRRTSGRRLVIVTNAGGMGAIAADEAEKLGLDVKLLHGKDQRRLRSEFKGNRFISNSSLGNPIDITASASTEEFLRVTEAVLGLPGYDLALVLPTHQTPAIGPDISAKLSEVVSKMKKPVAMCVMGNSELAANIHLEFMAKGIPSFPTPERAVRSLAAVPAYEMLRMQARKPTVGRQRAPVFPRQARGPLPQHQVSKLLRAYGIGEPKSVIVRSSRDLARLRGLSFPVACKLVSKELLHKTDVGGVAVDVGSIEEVEATLSRFKGIAKRKDLGFDGMIVQEMVRGGVEMILGGTRDATFGPVVIFGLGGIYTELIRDFTLAIAPVIPKEVRVMLASSRLGQILAGYRGGPRVHIDRLCDVVSAFSKIMVENPTIEEMELNPLVATADEILSVDSRVVAGSK